MSNETSSTPPQTRKITAANSALWTILTVALVAATLFTLWTPANLFSNQMLDNMFAAMQTNPTLTVATPTASPRPRIGIVAGHWGNDPGAVCPDGLTEVAVNLEIATRVQQQLLAEGFEVDLLEEFDERLNQYRALALVSIHNDSCNFINDEATGYKVAAAAASAYPEKAQRLSGCLIDRYGKATNMKFHINSITPDMVHYHTFSEIHTDTTAAIIETGFLNLDRRILTEQPDLVARGITDGILCYVRNEPIPVMDTGQ
ncbi:MAG: N-acetylmuramoyl-L-alanine amidase [Chloroflexota bacterium]|jgi:N-acetylmuramoyl-L-alanine amidase